MFIVQYWLKDKRYKKPRFIGTWGPDPEHPERNNCRFHCHKPEDAQQFVTRREAAQACYLLANDITVAILPVP